MKSDRRGGGESWLAGACLPGKPALATLLALIMAAALVLGAAVRWGEARAMADPAALAAARGPGSPDLPTLLFVFQAADCPSFGSLLDLWLSLQRRGAVHALAVGLDFPADTAAARRQAEGAGLALQFRPDLARPAERLIVGLGFRRTPVTLLLDAGGRVRLALPPPERAADHASLGEVVFEHAVRLRQEAAASDPFHGQERKGAAR